MREDYVYIMASRSRTLYIGVTNDLNRRVWEHKNGTIPGFTKKPVVNTGDMNGQRSRFLIHSKACYP